MPVVKHSRYSYAQTVSHLVESISAAGNTVFLALDQAAAAAQAGMTLRPTSLIVFGNPKGGTALMDAFPIAALDLPLKFLIWEEGAAVHVGYTPASELAIRHGVTGMDALIAAMDGTLETLSDSVV